MDRILQQHTGIEQVVCFRGDKKLRFGYTTGTCAAAAAQGAVRILLGETDLTQVHIKTPRGIELDLPLEEIGYKEEGEVRSASCGVRKDAGDDPDTTDGLLIVAVAQFLDEPGIRLEGGRGVGRVTLPGLSVPVGEAAINPVPRAMILQEAENAARLHGYEGGLKIVIQVPGGEEAAKKTFNPRLGIQGGISILGTSGIVEPMSERALVESIRVEMKQRIALGARFLAVTPGNYGQDFLNKEMGLSSVHPIKCGNFVGETIDMAVDLGLEGLLFVAHTGKFVKVAAGIMNTHSHSADARMEVLCAAAIRSGAPLETARAVLNCNSTDEALERIQKAGFLAPVIQDLTEHIQFYLDHRSYKRILLGAVIFSLEYGFLGQTRDAEELIRRLQKADGGHKDPGK